METQKVEQQPRKKESFMSPARKSEDDQVILLSSKEGSTLISEDVVAKIAGLAVREIEGVHDLVPFGASQTIQSIAQQFRGDEKRDIGVRVEVGKVETAIDIRVITDYGKSIPEIAEQVRTNVTQRIHLMTGLRVKEVNIEVVDLYFEEHRRRQTTLEPRVQ